MLLTDNEMVEIRAHHANGVKQTSLARTYGVPARIIGQVIHKANYRQRRTRWTEQTRRERQQRLKRAQRNAGLNTKLTREQVVDIKTRLACGERGEKIAQEYGISESTVSLIRKGKRWADVQAG